MYNFYQRPQKHSAKKFQLDMKKLWEENSEAVIQFINNAIVGSPEADRWAKALANNQQRIANGIIKFCGHKEKISALFNQFIQYIAQAIDIFLWKKGALKFRQEWCSKADEISNMLHSFNEWNVRDYLYKQIFLIESLIKSLIKRNKEAIEHYREELITNNINLATTLTNGIIKDNRNLFH